MMNPAQGPPAPCFRPSVGRDRTTACPLIRWGASKVTSVAFFSFGKKTDRLQRVAGRGKSARQVQVETVNVQRDTDRGEGARPSQAKTGSPVQRAKSDRTERRTTALPGQALESLGHLTPDRQGKIASHDPKSTIFTRYPIAAPPIAVAKSVSIGCDHDRNVFGGRAVRLDELSSNFYAPLEL